MKLKKFNEWWGFDDDEEPSDEEIVDNDLEDVNPDDDIYRTSDDFYLLEAFSKEYNLNVTSDQIVKFLKDF